MRFIGARNYDLFGIIDPINEVSNTYNAESIRRKAALSVGIVNLNGSQLCCGLLVGIDRFLLPLHALSGICLDEVKICFEYEDEQICSSQIFEIESSYFETNKDFDYAIVQIKPDYCDLRPGYCGLLPGHLCPIPPFSEMPKNNRFFLVHFLNDQKVVSTGVQCNGTSSDETSVPFSILYQEAQEGFTSMIKVPLLLCMLKEHLKHAEERESAMQWL